MVLKIGKSKEEVKKEKKRTQDLRERAKRKKCRESKPDQNTCKNCSMSGKCSVEGTQDWIKEEREEV